MTILIFQLQDFGFKWRFRKMIVPEYPFSDTFQIVNPFRFAQVQYNLLAYTQPTITGNILAV